MTHAHEWKWVYGLGDGVAAACECGVHLAPEEVNRRLNATERLSAEAVRDAASKHEDEWGFEWKWENEGKNPPTKQLFDVLMAYADTLDG